jgi:hypothetical protein
MKEVRTFDEVYSSIKKETADHEKQKFVKRSIQQPMEESEEEDSEAEYEIGEIPENLDYVDDNDINDQDREVLNGRILGLINMFQNVVQNTNIHG